jgi:hypothetical protein
VNFSSIVWGNAQFVMVGDGLVVTSPDGFTANWTPVFSDSASWLDLAWSGSQYAAVGADGAMMDSVNGITWTRRPNLIRSHLRGATWGNGEFLAVGENGVILSGIPAEEIFKDGFE